MSLEEQLSAVDSFHWAVSDAGHESPKFKQGIDIMKTKLTDASKDAKKGTAIVKTIKAAGAAIPDLTSGDPTKTLTALFGIIGTVAEMTGPEGVVIGIMLSLVSGIINRVSSQGTGQSVNDVIRDLMQEFNASGTSDEFRVAMNTMNGYEDLVLSRGRATSLNSEVHNNIGVNFLGNLANDMLHQAGEAKNLEDAQKVLRFVDIYCILSWQRELILQQKWLLLTLSGLDASALSLETSVIPDEIASKRERLRFIHLPSIKEAVVASVYNPSDWPRISAYMNHVGVPDPLHPKPMMRVQNQGEDMMAATLPPRYRKHMPTVYFTRITGSKFWLIHCRVEKLIYLSNSSFNPPRHTNLYLKVFRFGPYFVSFEESSLSPKEYIQKGHVNDYNSINVTFIDDKTCLLAAKAAPCAFFQFEKSVGFHTIHQTQPGCYYHIEANKGVGSNKQSHWMLESLTLKS